MRRIAFIIILLLSLSCSLFAQKEFGNQTVISSFFPQDEIDAKIVSLSNKPFSIVKSKAKFRIILFWNSWAVPSIPALDELSKRKTLLDKKSCEVFGIIPISKYADSKLRIEVNKDSIEQDKKYSYEFVNKFNVNFENGFLEDEELIRNLTLYTLPQVWITDSQGKILKKIFGYNPKKTFNVISEVIKNK